LGRLRPVIRPGGRVLTCRGPLIVGCRRACRGVACYLRAVAEAPQLGHRLRVSLPRVDRCARCAGLGHVAWPWLPVWRRPLCPLCEGTGVGVRWRTRLP
jgi:hypothetical protein